MPQSKQIGMEISLRNLIGIRRSNLPWKGAKRSQKLTGSNQVKMQLGRYKASINNYILYTIKAISSNIMTPLLKVENFMLILQHDYPYRKYAQVNNDHAD